MVFSVPFRNTLVLVCLLRAFLAHAEPSAPDGDWTVGSMLSRLDRWYANDWRSGWETGSRQRLMGSPYTWHFSYSPEHVNVFLLGLETERSDGFVAGGTLFSNSFGQPSSYLYVGQRFDKVYGIEPLFTYLTGGLLYGYRKPYNNKVPLNIGGFSPGAVASVGWKFTREFSGQINLLGNSGMMFQVAVELQ